jgi:CRISPR-associated protein Csm1
MADEQTTNDNVTLAALAGLLHDIGKFAQRAGVGKREIADAEARRDVKYEHALAGYSFVQDFAGALPAEARRELSGVAYHHAPKSDADERVRLADWLSAGERDELDGDKDDRRVPYMRSAFSRLQGFDAARYLPLKRLRFARDAIFPQQHEHAEWKDAYRDEYFKLWEQFEQACKLLKTVSNPVLYLEMLYQRMLEFTWCIPSAYYNAIPDVSLYDHNRMTAALAACLTQDGRSGEWCRAVKDSDEVAVLVAGDISGVQHFIYTLASSGAAKTLRGRSFYLQMLTEVVADFVLRQLGLPSANLIYAGGGNFYLLVGVTQQDQLQDLSREVTRRLVKAHGGALHLTLAHTMLTQADFQRTRFAEAWRRLHEECLLPAKHRPLVALPESEVFELVGAPLGVGGDNDHTCSICGAEQQKGEQFEPDTIGAEEIRKCELCQSFETLGSALAHATHLVWLKAPIPAEPADVRDWQVGLENLGVRIGLINTKKALEGQNALPDLADVTLARISMCEDTRTDDKAIRDQLGKIPIVQVVRPLARLVPLREDKHAPTGKRPAMFDELAQVSHGIERWGVLRMDVDNLGRLFQRGFERSGENSLTLSRLASFSLHLRLFFEGWLPHLAGPQDDGGADLSNKLYLQYAGGDDLFIVGAWDALPLFAERVRCSFADFACQNPAVTLSGGISLATEKYPLYQAARDADDAEKAAKGLREDKNALTFLGQPVIWEQFADMRERAYELDDWCARGAPKALIQTLIEIAAASERDRKQNKSRFGRWMWVSFYQLTRAAMRAKDAEVKEGIIAIRNELLKSEGLIGTIGLSARWAELLNRRRE